MNEAYDHKGTTRGAVVRYCCKAGANGQDHESTTQRALAKKLAALKQFDFAGDFDAARRYGCPLYFVPSDTLIADNFAHTLAIRGKQDLFGGVVPYPFAATKTITHGLAAAGAAAPHGWSARFAQQVQEVVLPGFSAFSLNDAGDAGRRLLERGSVRIKQAGGIGGLGQSVANDAAELEAGLQALDELELRRDGVVIERNLNEVSTLSVGQALIGEVLATYYGTQRLTRNNRGQQVYGGSTLMVVRGDFDRLLQLDLSPEVRTAIAQARTYHSAAMECFAGMFASRCNYDIAQGVDDEGRWHSGVLEQSWRIGGASGAELAAHEAFRADSALELVCSSTTEVYGDHAAVPSDATVYFQGVDERVGALTKYARLESHANT